MQYGRLVRDERRCKPDAQSVSVMDPTYIKEFQGAYSKVVVDVRSDVEVLRAWAIRSEKDVARGRKSCVIGGDIESRCLDILPLSKISEEACWS